MISSYPSKPITLIDVPEIKEFSGEFIYQFFSKKERLLEKNRKTGQLQAFDIPDEFRFKSAETLDEKRFDRLISKIPRYNKLVFVPAKSQNAGYNEFIPSLKRENKTTTLIRDALQAGKLQDESSFANNAFFGITFQDDIIDNRLKFLTSGSIAKRYTAKNRELENSINDKKSELVDKLSSEYSLLDAARALADQTSMGVSNSFIASSLSYINEQRLKIISDDEQSILSNDAFERVRDVNVRAQFNNKIIGKIVSNIVNDPISQFSNDFASSLQDAKRIEEESKNSHSSNIMSPDEYDGIFEALSTSPAVTGDYQSRTEVIGYLIEKSELESGASVPVKLSPIILENPDASQFIDENVRYGSTYIYTIRTVAKVSIGMVIEDSDNSVIATGLVTSRKSRRVVVKCIDEVSPPPPADFNIMWNHENSSPTLMWNLPVNPQRDIKKFQVFRRKSINEAFQLIKEIDFDDSEILTARRESPRNDLIEKNDSISTRFIDDEFNIQQNYIYAVACIDAHALSSGYSVQFEVSFNRFANKIEKHLISQSGAPKAYPNLYLKKDIFIDTINDSNHSRMRIFFDPELLQVHDKNGNELRLISTKKQSSAEPKINSIGSYQLQFINVDLGQQEIIDLNILDERTPNNELSSFEQSIEKDASTAKKSLMRNSRV